MILITPVTDLHLNQLEPGLRWHSRHLIWRSLKFFSCCFVSTVHLEDLQMTPHLSGFRLNFPTVKDVLCRFGRGCAPLVLCSEHPPEIGGLLMSRLPNSQPVSESQSSKNSFSLQITFFSHVKLIIDLTIENNITDIYRDRVLSDHNDCRFLIYS